MRHTRILSAFLCTILLLAGSSSAFALTPSQLQSLKANIAASTDTVPAGVADCGGFVGLQVNAVPNSADGNYCLASLYNQISSPAFYVYRTSIPVAEVFDAIVWANFTPSDAVPTDTALNNAIFQSRQIACQTKQMNVQTILMGQSTLNGAKPNIRSGLQDALTQIPSGANGALRAAGWVTVRDSVLARQARRIEKLYADTSGGNGSAAASAATLTFEGTITGSDIEAARNS